MALICIVDYGIGNIHSAMKGFRCFTDDVILSENPDEIRAASALVLPGQGAFGAGMRGLTVRGLLPEVLAAGNEGKPILGICLGAQLLLQKGYEFGECAGLGFMEGNVVRMPTNGKLPHMGWNSVHPPKSDAWKGSMMEGVQEGSEMYFIHSYILQPADTTHVLAITDYDGCSFTSVIAKDNIIGCQFHPEKSGKSGMCILQNFVALAKKW